ncbi:hypothetical protein P3X46_017918 [Hevea brasiliensis]|uniref:RING-type domain-containing protein n=2 Tax=Hevea brasiliensis TaxID=3981 RepID=A0ABQ9LSY1_HEVBR|nr:uncharacterized protein LOC110666039 isoform X2 [Hevea brasiliensis]XP_021682072.2 uncharacterized protein LOC110666039 isoform X2 [Hevea brasiliensis]KAJ9169763.1 hypothetical protein P3X46_017918 [Hevea brasiliensis]
MSAIENSRDLAGLTLNDVLSSEKQPTVEVSHTPALMNRTLLDIIRDEEPDSLFGHKDKKTWKAFRDRLRLKRAGSAWISSVPIPASDIPIRNNNSFSNTVNNPRSLMSRRNSVRFTNVSGESTQADDSNDHSAVSSYRPQMSRRTSSRFSSLTPSESTRLDESSRNAHAVGDELPSRSFRPQMSRHNSTRTSDLHLDSEEEPGREGSRRLGAALAEERVLSAREAVAAQEAAEAEAAAQAAAAEEEAEEEASGATGEGAAEAQPVRMSLMDLLEETDRQMGFEGSRYIMGDEDEECEEEDDDEDGADGGDGIEHTCCVCMVRHKGAAFIPCGHTFCRLCSRELWVQRGNCPLCNGFILEILDIF